MSLTATARPWHMTRALTSLSIPAGMSLLAVGFVVVEGGEDSWLGALRSADYVGPALLVSGISSQVAMALGTLVALTGMAALLLGVYRLAAAVDARTQAARAGTATRTARGPAARWTTMGALATSAGLALTHAAQRAVVFTQTPSLDRVGRLIGLESGGRGAAVAGAALALAGASALALGVFRLVGEIHELAGDGSSSSESGTAA